MTRDEIARLYQPRSHVCLLHFSRDDCCHELIILFSYQTEWQWNAWFHLWKMFTLGTPASQGKKILADTKITKKSGEKMFFYHSYTFNSYLISSTNKIPGYFYIVLSKKTSLLLKYNIGKKLNKPQTDYVSHSFT